MIKIEKTWVGNFEGSFRGMRNPKNSWIKADSKFGFCDNDSTYLHYLNEATNDMEFENDEEREKYTNFLAKNSIINTSNNIDEYAFIGPKDLKLAQTLVAAGKDHRKFLRQIQVCADFTLPLFVWKEFDTYKVGTVANSCSTMHTLANTVLSLNLFSFDGAPPEGETMEEWKTDVITSIVMCEQTREKFLKTKDMKYWKRLIQLLPESFMQKRTVTLNYEVLRNMYFARRHHKLDEWHQICEWIESLPYAAELICYEKTKEASNG